MSNWVQKYNIGCFYHFTDSSNLESIRAQGGLLSLAELGRRQVQGFTPGGNQWSHDSDRRKGVDDYVHLSFLKEHPMEYRAKEDGRINETVWFKINPAIVYEAGVLFVNDVSNKAGVETFGFAEVEENIDLEALYRYLDWKCAENRERRNACVKSEVLIPRFIALANMRIVENG
tara:strand:+ start:528 stop:1049 length:522 start_codon:yes stop_codon:yes gene_type:complete